MYINVKWKQTKANTYTQTHTHTHTHTHIYIYIYIFTKPSARVGYVTRSIFNRFESRVFILLDLLPHQG